MTAGTQSVKATLATTTNLAKCPKTRQKNSVTKTSSAGQQKRRTGTLRGQIPKKHPSTKKSGRLAGSPFDTEISRQSRRVTPWRYDISCHLIESSLGVATYHGKLVEAWRRVILCPSRRVTPRHRTHHAHSAEFIHGVVDILATRRATLTPQHIMVF